MSLKTQLKSYWRDGAIGALLAVLVGLLLGTSRLGDGLRRGSFDVPFFFAPPAGTNDVVLVLIDDPAATDLLQTNPGPGNSLWSRRLHADLIQLLKRAGSKLVVMDFQFSGPSPTGDAEEDALLTKALRDHGNVVLASVSDQIRSPRALGATMTPPFSDFLDAVGETNWGRAGFFNDLGVRRHVPETELFVSLPWVAAHKVNAPVTQQPYRRLEKRWIRYYAPSGAFRVINYTNALVEANAHLFKDQVVFIGGDLPAGGFGESKDTFRTPFSRWESSRLEMPGVEILATMFLNLVKEDWLRQISLLTEVGLLVLFGGAFGFGLASVRPMTGVGVALLAMLLIAALSIVLVWSTYVWWAWMIVVTAQIPCAFLWSLLAYTRRLARAPAAAPLPAPAPGTAAVPAPGAAQRIPAIPDHTLVREIGKGAYGEVWLARNTIGLFRAVKIVYRARFEKAAPFEREYRGMQRFMPISLDHPSFLRIFHVGRDDPEGHFYYIMEIGDDELRGQDFDPQTYSPKNLSKELKKRPKLPLAECLRLFIPLSSALDHLHRKNLVHRDIKPSNIIFVHDVPKLADIGLVAELRAAPGHTSYVGTPDYIAPEGPGTAVADIYSLGIVFFEAAFGDLPDHFSDQPTAVTSEEAPAELNALGDIIQKAHENDPRARYQSAAELHDALVGLQAKLGLAGD
jgi:CHASE2 domain-containing sensor protein